MKTSFLLSTLVASGLTAATGLAQAQEILARVISSTAVIQQIAVPRQQCTNTPVTSQVPPSGAGALMGAIAGGAVGNAVGDGGSGRALATMIGIVGGAVMGSNIEGPKTQVQNVQQCTTVTSYENRTMHYDVVYEYADKRYNIQMLTDPGQYVRLQVNPVGILPPGKATQAPQTYQQYQQNYQPDAVTSQTTTVYTTSAPRVVYAYGHPGPYFSPYYFPYATYAPYARYAPYPPIGVSLNLGYSSGGHSHRSRR